MNRLLLLCVALCASACVSQTEYMAKVGQGARDGALAGARIPRDVYFYHYGQVGGQGTAQNSMGTAVAFDGQKSFADAMQFATTYGLSLNETKVLLRKETTKMFEAGQITIQKRDALFAALETSKSADSLQLALAEIAKRP